MILINLGQRLLGGGASSGSGPIPPPSDLSGSSPWHIIAGEIITVRTRRQMTIHGEFLNEGELILEGTAQLVIEN